MTLYPLSRTTNDDVLPDAAYDVRGWEVRTEPDDATVGSVDDMLVDDHGTPRYLDVELEESGRHVLVPLARAHADRDDERVWVEGLREEQLEQLPDYDHDADSVTPEYEERLEEDYRRVVRGEAPEGPADEGRLVRLGAIEDLQVSEADTDPRGWTVVTGDGTEIGEVAELIVDRREMTARYLDVAVDEEILELEPVDRHVLIPVSRTRLHADDEYVSVDGLFARDLKDYPPYAGLPLARDREREIDEIYVSEEEAGKRRWSDPGARHFFGWQGRPARPEERIERGEDEARAGEPRREKKTATVPTGDGEVRIRVRGDDIIIEKHGGGE